MPDMSIAMAREIVHQGHKNGAWEGDPSKISDEQALKDAGELVGLARQAYDNSIRADAVMEILFAACVEPTADNPNYYDEVYARHPEAAKPTPSAAPASAAPAAPETPAPAASNGTFDINSIIPGYDDLKVGEIVEAMKSLTPEQVAAVKAYEASDGERKTIMNFELPPPPAPAPAAPAAVAASGSSEDYGSSAALETAYSSGTLGMDRAAQQSLFVPPPYTGEEPLLPIDITAIGDADLSRLAQRFHALEAHTLWLVSQEEGRALAAEHLYHEHHREATLRERGRLEAGLEKKTEAALDRARQDSKELAEDDEATKAWRNRQRRHEIEAKNLKALAAGYESAVVRLSREQSRRENLTTAGS